MSDVAYTNQFLICSGFPYLKRQFNGGWFLRNLVSNY